MLQTPQMPETRVFLSSPGCVTLRHSHWLPDEEAQPLRHLLEIHVCWLLKDPDSANGSEPRHLCNLHPGAFVGGRNDLQAPAGSFLLTFLFGQM